ncbi:MAG: hypothetical protein Q4B58_01140 [Bacteroidales bacterium]|nr:hypothetical protein [Bacteroidales bacterium]
MVKHCIVADLSFSIDTDDQELLALLALRYAPFSRCASECSEVQQLFSLKHCENHFSEETFDFVQRFDCEGCQCVYERSATGVRISILEHQADKISAQMQCDSHFSEAYCWLSGDVDQREFCINNFLMMLYAFASMNKHTLLFHASVVACRGKGYLFLGKSGTGKSTHSSLWLKHVPGCELVNDDNPVVGIRQGKVVVYGSPWSGKTPCYRDVSYEVGAFVQIARDKVNLITSMDAVQAFVTLLPACSGVKWDKQLYRSQCDAITELVERTKVFLLNCRPDAEAALVCSSGVGL